MALSIPYEHFGGRGPILHFAHANAYTPGCYRGLLSRLSEKYQVIAIRHRPLWPESRPESIDDWHAIAEDMIRFFDTQGLSQVIGLGHSLGAVTSMMASLKRPDLFKTLLLIEPVFLEPAFLKFVSENGTGLDTDTFPPVRVALRRRNHWPDRETAFNHMRPKRVFARLSDEALWDYVKYGLSDSADGGVKLSYPPKWEARIYATPPVDVWDLIPRVTHPTLAIRGAGSDTLSVKGWHLWQLSQSEATFVEVAGSSHLLPMEKPAEVAEIINRYLDRGVAG